MTSTSPQDAPLDGRSLRSVRSRRAVVEAFLDLLSDGEEQPTAQQVADRSGVSPSTIFRLFEDLDGMHAEAMSVQIERFADLLKPIPPTGSLAERVEAIVTVRSRLYEKAAPLLRFQSRMVDNSPGARSNRAQVNAFFRNQLAELFAEEIEDSRSPLLDSLDALLSWEAWDRLRSVQGLSARQARQVVVCWLGSSLGV